MKAQIVSLLLVFLFLSCVKQKRENKLDSSEQLAQPEKNWVISSTTDWVKNKGLINVESIIYDKENKVFYATNGVNYGLGTDGFISKITENGIVEKLKWIDSLNRPTGMAIHDSLLYVADVNSLIVINTGNGSIVKKYLEPIPNSGLNDVCISKKGEVFVSASFVHSIFKLDYENLVSWIQDEEKLKWANGLIANDKELLVAGLNLSTIDLNTKVISKIDLNPPTKDFDGITGDGSNGYFLTTVENSGLFHLNKQKNIIKLMQEDVYFGDMTFNPNQKKIYIPRGNRKTDEFFITVFTLLENQ